MRLEFDWDAARELRRLLPYRLITFRGRKTGIIELPLDLLTDAVILVIFAFQIVNCVEVVWDDRNGTG